MFRTSTVLDYMAGGLKVKKAKNGMTLLIACFLTACVVSQKEATTKLRLIAFGDSYSAWSNNYVPQLSAALNREMHNEAINSTRLTSPNQLPLMLSYQYKQSDIVIMLIGFNDVCFWQTNPAGLIEFRANVKQLVAHFAKVGIPTYIGTPAGTMPDFLVRYGVDPSFSPQYAQIIRDELLIAAAPNLHLVDVSAKFPVNEDTTSYALGHHPSDYGHSLIANLFLEAMNE